MDLVYRSIDWLIGWLVILYVECSCEFVIFEFLIFLLGAECFITLIFDFEDQVVTSDNLRLEEFDESGAVEVPNLVQFHRLEPDFQIGVEAFLIVRCLSIFFSNVTFWTSIGAIQKWRQPFFDEIFWTQLVLSVLLEGLQRLWRGGESETFPHAGHLQETPRRDPQIRRRQQIGKPEFHGHQLIDPR